MISGYNPYMKGISLYINKGYFEIFIYTLEDEEEFIEHFIYWKKNSKYK